MMAETSAHEKTVQVRFIERWPAHEPREEDPHYKAFHAAKARMKKAGLLVCNVKSKYHYGVIELHHAYVEFAHVNDIDLTKFNEIYGLDLSDEAFRNFVEGAPAKNAKGEDINALEPLCTGHHRGTEGIHSLDGPSFNVMRAAKDDHPIFIVQSNNAIPVEKS
jgi:hypothetical protein